MSNKSKKFLKIINDMNDSSGFFSVHRNKADNPKGYRWVYYYTENNQRKSISNVHLHVLKHVVISGGLPWRVINKSKAKESVDLEKSKFHLFDSGSGILFVDVVNKRFDPFNGFWRYRYDEVEILDADLRSIAVNVERKGLPWIVLNEANYENSLKSGICFKSGIRMVNRVRFKRNLDMFKWIYIYGKYGEYAFIINEDLNMLKEEVIEKGISWEIIDGTDFNRSLIDNEINLAKIRHFNWSETGFYRVRKVNKENCSQGFVWTYKFRRKNKRIDISSTDLLELKRKVLDKGFKWEIVDEKQSEKSVRENQSNLEKHGFSTNRNKTGIFRVYKSRAERTPQGFYWAYGCKKDKKRKRITSVDLLKLKEKVMNQGFPWKIVDEDLYER